MRKLIASAVIILALAGCTSPVVEPFDVAFNKTLIPALEEYLANDPDIPDYLLKAYRAEIRAGRRTIAELGGTPYVEIDQDQVEDWEDTEDEAEEVIHDF